MTSCWSLRYIIYCFC